MGGIAARASASAPASSMNEGHCAFLGLERIRQLIHEQGMSFREALEIVTASGLFMTHTPVPAGIDVFSPDQIERYFASFRETFGLTREQFLDLGRAQPGQRDEFFNMAVLAIRTASVVNGVSRLHARISRAMWRNLWPGVPTDEIPIAHVTNGVHPQSWISNEMRTLRHLSRSVAEQAGDTRVWRRNEQIPPMSCARTSGGESASCRSRKARSATACVAPGSPRWRKRGSPGSEGANHRFGRRFATYKRATLILGPVRSNGFSTRPLDRCSSSSRARPIRRTNRGRI